MGETEGTEVGRVLSSGAESVSSGVLIVVGTTSFFVLLILTVVFSLCGKGTQKHQKGQMAKVRFGASETSRSGELVAEKYEMQVDDLRLPPPPEPMEGSKLKKQHTFDKKLLESDMLEGISVQMGPIKPKTPVAEDKRSMPEELQDALSKGSNFSFIDDPNFELPGPPPGGPPGQVEQGKEPPQTKNKSLSRSKVRRGKNIPLPGGRPSDSYLESVEERERPESIFRPSPQYLNQHKKGKVKNPPMVEETKSTISECV